MTERLLGLSTGCDWSLSGHGSKLDCSAAFSAASVTGPQKGTCSTAEHMLLLKVRDVQSKTPEINNTRVCLAE